MSLFRKVGEKVERFKQQAQSEAARDQAVCEDCGETFGADYDACPDCGSEAVRPAE